MRALHVAVVLALASALPPAVASAQTVGDSKPSLADQKFLKEAAGGGAAEVRLGRLALDKAASPEVKQFAQRIVEDHGKANEQLKAAVAAQGVSVSAEMPADARKSYERLSKLSGDAFDRAYVQDMVKDHRKDVTLFEDQAKNGKDPALKQFAQATLPTLQAHLQMAERLVRGR